MMDTHPSIRRLQITVRRWVWSDGRETWIVAMNGNDVLTTESIAGVKKILDRWRSAALRGHGVLITQINWENVPDGFVSPI